MPGLSLRREWCVFLFLSQNKTRLLASRLSTIQRSDSLQKSLAKFPTKKIKSKKFFLSSMNWDGNNMRPTAYPHMPHSIIFFLILFKYLFHPWIKINGNIFNFPTLHLLPSQPNTRYYQIHKCSIVNRHYFIHENNKELGQKYTKKMNKICVENIEKTRKII